MNIVNEYGIRTIGIMAQPQTHTVVELCDWFTSLNDLYPNIICKDGKCWPPCPTNYDGHFLIIKRK